MTTLNIPSVSHGNLLLHTCTSTQTLVSSESSTPKRSRSSSVDSINREKMHNQSKPTHKSRLWSIRHYVMQELDSKWMGIVIVTCFFSSGLVDSVAFNSWNCFVGMQTGNTIFAALGIGGQPQASHRQQYFKSLISIASFCMGTLFFNALHRYPTKFHQTPNSRRRAIFIISFAIQTILILVAALLVSSHVVSNRPFVSGYFSSGNQNAEDEDDLTETNYLDLCPIALLAFGAAGQVCLSRVLALIELPTIVLSTLYHDFTGDLYNLRDSWHQTSSAVSNEEKPAGSSFQILARTKSFLFVQQKRQLKRLASIIALFLGGIVGGELYKTSIGMAGALFLAMALKAIITVSFLFWRKDPDFEDENEDNGTILPK